MRQYGMLGSNINQIQNLRVQFQCSYTRILPNIIHALPSAGDKSLTRQEEKDRKGKQDKRKTRESATIT